MWIAVTFIAKTPQEKEEMSRDFDGMDKKYTKALISSIRSKEYS